jgi:hypothetical protein
LQSFEITAREKTYYDVNLDTDIGSEDSIAFNGVRVLAFATLLKRYCMQLFGLTVDQCYGSNEQKNTATKVEWENMPLWVRLKYAGAKWYKPWTWSPMFGYMTARQVLQVMGTEVIRKIYTNAWADALYRTAAAAKEDVVIVPDCRFPNEITRDVVVPKHIKVIHVRLLRNKYPEDRHPSETALDDYSLDAFDAVLRPDVDLNFMRRQAAHYASEWGRIIGLTKRQFQIGRPYQPQAIMNISEQTTLEAQAAQQGDKL